MPLRPFMEENKKLHSAELRMKGLRIEDEMMKKRLKDIKTPTEY